MYNRERKYHGFQKSLSKAAAKDGAAPKPARRPRKERKFPALTFEEALVLPEAIQKFASGQKVRSSHCSRSSTDLRTVRKHER